jgi:F-type H+-transporting ATPase subunit b
VLIDWFTIIAQIVNFLILVALLKRFLYDRIIRAMDERESKIRARLDDARKKSAEAEEEAQFYREKKKQWETKRQEMMDQARKEAEEERKSLVGRAREEAEDQRTRWRESVQKEKNAFVRELRRMTAGQVYGISRRALSDLADSDVEEQMAEAFLSRIKDLPSERKTRLGDAIRDNGNLAAVTSGFELSQGERQKITRAVHEEFSPDAEVAYKTDRDLIMGVEIKGKGEKTAWSIEHYLEQLEAEARDKLDL